MSFLKLRKSFCPKFSRFGPEGAKRSSQEYRRIGWTVPYSLLIDQTFPMATFLKGTDMGAAIDNQVVQPLLLSLLG